MTKLKDIKAMMKGYGFHVLRERNHLVWTNGRCIIVTAKTASCKHAMENIRHEVLRRTRINSTN